MIQLINTKSSDSTAMLHHMHLENNGFRTLLKNCVADYFSYGLIIIKWNLWVQNQMERQKKTFLFPKNE